LITQWDWNTDFKEGQEGTVKNLKLLYEKVDDYDWQESLGKEPIGKKLKKLREGRTEHQYRLDKQSRRLRLTWE
jgi:hypothetical protein